MIESPPPRFWMLQLRALAVLLVAFMVLLAMILPIAGGPPTLSPPEITKRASKEAVSLGEQVKFTIAVVNPNDENRAEWIAIRVTDEIDPAFRIDSVTLDPPSGDVEIDGNRVLVKVASLAPGESFQVTIRCTLVGPAEPGDTLENEAKLSYKDEAGDPQPSVWSDPVEIRVVEPPSQTLEIVKEVSPDCVDVGLPVRFTVTVANPSQAAQTATWYKLLITDEIDEVLRIDQVTTNQSFSGESGASARILEPGVGMGGRVAIEIDELKPGESLVITIDCTLMSIPSPWRLVTNQAKLEYEDAAGKAQSPVLSDRVTVGARTCGFIPLSAREVMP